MPIYRYFEIIGYELISFVPYLLLIIYPFRKNLRFSKVTTTMLLILVVSIRIGYNFWAHVSQTRGTAPFPLALYCLLCLFFLKTHLGKTFFTMTMIANIANFITTAAKCLEGLLFPELADGLHRWSNILTLLGIQLIVILPLTFYVKKVFTPALTKNPNSSSVWRYLWCVPLTFYAVWFRNYYFSAEGADVLARRPQHVLFTFLINAGAMLIYTLIVQLISEHEERERLIEREHQLQLLETNYVNIKDRINEARRAKHDLRQHIHVMSAYLKDQKYEELENYLNRYQKTLPEEGVIYFCENYAVNALLQYFSGYAKINVFGFSAQVVLPNNCGIPDEVLTVILGNLLENATEACIAEGSGALLSVRGQLDGNSVFFKLINSASQPPKTDQNGRYLSSKREGYGIGLQSVKDITEKYNGLMKTKWENGMFTVSVLLNF